MNFNESNKYLNAMTFQIEDSECDHGLYYLMKETPKYQLKNPFIILIFY